VEMERIIAGRRWDKIRFSRPGRFLRAWNG
jgi:hypothetical protein